MSDQQLVKSVDKAIVGAGPGYASTISKYQWALVPDSQLLAAKTALTKSDFLMKIAADSPEYVENALMHAAILGVDLTEGKRQAYLVPRKNQRKQTVIQLQVGYKGVEAIHQRMGVIDRLSIRVVRQQDEYDWSGDDAEKPKHNPGRFKTDEERGPIEGAFSVTYFPDGSIQVATAAISEIYEKHRDVSDSWKDYKKKVDAGQWAFPPPWVTFEKAMVEKTMAFIAAKQWPANYRDHEIASKIVSTLHEIDVSDYTELSAGYTSDQKEAFDAFIEGDDSLGLMLFMRYVGDRVYTNLYNSGAKGKKCALKKTCSDMEHQGNAIYQIALDAIAAGENMLLLEQIEDCLPVTINLFKKSLSSTELSAFNEMTPHLETKES